MRLSPTPTLPRKSVWTGDIEDSFSDPFGDIEDTCRPSGRGVGEGTISMPWRELTVIDQREEFVKLAMLPKANMSELCRRFGISRSNGNKWVGRYLTEGREGLADRSRRPGRSPTRTAETVEAEVLRI